MAVKKQGVVDQKLQDLSRTAKDPVQTKKIKQDNLA
jgi:hypothetical protein